VTRGIDANPGPAAVIHGGVPVVTGCAVGDRIVCALPCASAAIRGAGVVVVAGRGGAVRAGTVLTGLSRRAGIAVIAGEPVVHGAGRAAARRLVADRLGTRPGRRRAGAGGAPAACTIRLTRLPRRA